MDKRSTYLIRLIQLLSLILLGSLLLSCSVKRQTNKQTYTETTQTEQTHKHLELDAQELIRSYTNAHRLTDDSTSIQIEKLDTAGRPTERTTIISRRHERSTQQTHTTDTFALLLSHTDTTSTLTQSLQIAQEQTQVQKASPNGMVFFVLTLFICFASITIVALLGSFKPFRLFRYDD